MKITLQNYEEYFVRFIDNELSEDERKEVAFFLQENPGLESELEAFKTTILTPDVSMTFRNKEALKRGISISNYDDYFARLIENDLSDNEVQEVNLFLQKHPELQQEMTWYKRTVAVPDLSVVYPDKRSLKKREGARVVPMYARYILTAAVAASVMLLLVIRGIDKNDSGTSNPVAEQHTVNPPAGTTADETNTVAQQEHFADQSSTQVASAETNQPASKTKRHNKMITTPEQQDHMMLAEQISPMNLDESNGLPYYRKVSRAPYLTFSKEGETPAAVNRGSGASWTSMASVIGSEILKLSGRGDLLRESRDTTNQPKITGPVALSIDTERFAFYHKFFKKKKSSSTEKNN